MIGDIGCWSESGSIIRFSVSSIQIGGLEWIEKFKQKGVKVSTCAQILLSSEFPSFSNKEVHYKVVVMKGELFSDGRRDIDTISKAAFSGQFTQQKKMLIPNHDLACLVRKFITQRDMRNMGLKRIIFMHEFNPDFSKSPLLLNIFDDDGVDCLGACDGKRSSRKSADDGFAYLES